MGIINNWYPGDSEIFSDQHKWLIDSLRAFDSQAAWNFYIQMKMNDFEW